MELDIIYIKCASLIQVSEYICHAAKLGYRIVDSSYNYDIIDPRYIKCHLNNGTAIIVDKPPYLPGVSLIITDDILVLPEFKKQ